MRHPQCHCLVNSEFYHRNTERTESALLIVMPRRICGKKPSRRQNLKRWTSPCRCTVNVAFSAGTTNGLCQHYWSEKGDENEIKLDWSFHQIRFRISDKSSYIIECKLDEKGARQTTFEALNIHSVTVQSTIHFFNRNRDRTSPTEMRMKRVKNLFK